jgi:hypothetical protein
MTICTRSLGALICFMLLGPCTVQADPITLVDLAGDKDGFGTGKALGSLIDYNNETVWEPSDGAFDRELRSSFNWEHEYSLPSVATILGASLRLVVLDVDDGYTERGDDYYNVRLFLDGVEVAGAFDGVTDGNVGHLYPSKEIVFALAPPYLSLLGDGKLAVSVDPLGGFGGLDGIMIDYSELQVTASPVPVPEPSTLLLLGSGLAGMITAHRRRKK